MEECLAIKPDLCFLWDESWYAYATFNPVLRKRTGMSAARLMARVLRSETYKVCAPGPVSFVPVSVTFGTQVRHHQPPPCTPPNDWA